MHFLCCFGRSLDVTNALINGEDVKVIEMIKCSFFVG